MMPPFNSTFVGLQPRANASQYSQTSKELRQQWTQPTDVFSILLLLGGEIVNRALAQLAGGILTPVTFSFGKSPPVYRGISFSACFLLTNFRRLGFVRSSDPSSKHRRCETDAACARRTMLADNREKRLHPQQHQLDYWSHASRLRIMDAPDSSD
jgi:hypothetical protein